MCIYLFDTKTIKIQNNEKVLVKEITSFWKCLATLTIYQVILFLSKENSK